MTDKNLMIGVEEQSDIPVNTDAYGIVDDGEYAVVYAVSRFSKDGIVVMSWLCEGGLTYPDIEYGVKNFDVDPEERTEEWTERYTQYHRESIQRARDYFRASSESHDDE